MVAPVNFSRLQKAFEARDTQKIKDEFNALGYAHRNIFLITKLNDVNANLTNEIPLHWAIENRQDELALFFIENGSNLNPRDDLSVENTIGETALHSAAFFSKENVVKALLEAGADPCLRSKEKNKNSLEYLFDLDSRDLDQTEVDNKIKILNLLVQKNIDLNSQDAEGNTVLHKLCLEGSVNAPELIKALLGKGADINTKNSNGETALFYLLEHCKNDFVSVEELTRFGWSILGETLKLLIEKTALDDAGFEDIKPYAASLPSDSQVVFLQAVEEKENAARNRIVGKKSKNFNFEMFQPDDRKDDRDDPDSDFSNRGGLSCH